MSLGSNREDDGVPPTKKPLIVLAVVLMLIPVVALLWVGSYARTKPELAGFPFFFWYQLMWVFLCAGLSWLAYLCVRAARPRRGGSRGAHR